MVASRKSPSIRTLPTVVAECLDRYVVPNQSLVIGLSGGIDSTVLLHAVHACGYPVSALHVHHGLSPRADEWAALCVDACQRWQIDIRVEQVVVERDSGDGLEAAARRVRHAAYDRASADWLLLAHHRGDRAETMLFNLLRGAGVRGAGALPERNGRLLRPLLRLDRADILGYARMHGLAWVDDESNADVRHARNFLRHRVLPKIEERFPAALARLAAAAGRFAEAADLLDQLATLDLGGRPAEFPVDVSLLAGLSEPRARNVLRFLLSRAGVGVPSEERLVEILRQGLSAAPDRHPAVAFGDRVLRRRTGQLHLD
jgi:tRNA(Ile)-lysidine synthase